MGDSFTHLHVHTEYSMLDGAARLDELVAKAAADGQPALGITDHGNMYGILDFYKECRKRDVKPILGMEAYMAHDTRHERPSRRGRVDDSGGDTEGGRKLYYHLTLLAENNDGYKNLIQLSSLAFLEGYFYKPRCLTPEQEILTDRGVKRAEDIEVGDRVLTHRGRFRSVTQVMSRQADEEIVGLELNNRYGRVTWLTAEHPILIRHRDGSRSWVEAGSIAPGRRGRRDGIDSWQSWACLPRLRPDSGEATATVLTAPFVGNGWFLGADGRFVKSSPRSGMGPTRHYSNFATSIELDYDFGYFVGLYLAEGRAADGAVALTLHRDESPLIDAAQTAMKRLAGGEARVTTRHHRPGYQGVDVVAYCAPFARFLANAFGSGAANKRLPAFAMEGPDDFKRGILDGVLAGDGAEKDWGWIFMQTSRELAWQVRQLAATFTDSFPSIAEYDDGDPKHATQYRSNIARKGRSVRTVSDDDFVYRPIAALHRRRYRGPVYNFEVEEDHSYVSDFAIHNCDWELLEKYSSGLMATSGCLGGHVLQSILNGDDKGALEKAGRFQDIFGRDNFFIEVQDHGLQAQHDTNPKLIELARRINAPLIATNDSHYTHREDHDSHDALLCVQTGALMSDPKRFKFEGHEHYLKSAEEMRWLFRELPEACDNTLWVAERAAVEIEFGKVLLPNFPLPEGFSDDTEYLHHLTWEGAKERWGNELPADVVERVSYELQVIANMGFSSYFLIVWDLIRHAKSTGIRVGPGRGSAAGCAVAYCLRITDLDPIKYDLLFERFLNPSRVSMPDIDMDFDSRYRDEMIRYAAEKYGRDRVAQIVTFSTIKARAAVRDAARVLGLPYGVGDRAAKAMPPLVMGRDTPLKYCFEESEKYKDGYKAAAELRAMYDADPDVKKVVDVARGLEGLRRQDGIHAAAVVITKDPLTDYLPIQRKPEAGKPVEEAPVVTQYEMHGVEDLGLLKMDFLGLRNLDVITDAVGMIRQKHPDFDIDSVSLEDLKVYELLGRGDTIGVFQLESPPMRALLKSMAPNSFEDVSAVLALYRPGPMSVNMHYDYADRKNGRQEVTYFHEDAREVLGDTYGLMIYQESVMRVSQKFAGYSLAEADNLRKACLPAGSRMLSRSRGYVPIENVMKLRDRRVQTIDTTSATSRFEEVADVWSVGVKPVSRLTTSTGYVVEATDNHPFLVDDRWVELRNVVPGDLVGVAAATHSHGGSKISAAEIDLSALLISEGYTPDQSLGRRSPHFCNTDPELLAAFADAYAEHFGEPHRRVSRIGTLTRLRLTPLEVDSLVGRVIGRLGLSAEKTIPDAVLNAPLEKVERFLGLYFCADGWADASGAHFASKSSSVVRSLKRLLLRCGVVSNIHSRTIAGHGVHYTVSVADKGQAKRFASIVEPHLTAIKQGKVERWLREWGDARSATNIGIPSSFLSAEVERRMAVTGRSKRSLGVDTGGYASSRVLHRATLDGLLYSERLEDLRSGDLIWDTVVSVEYVGDKQCFDFRMANQERPYALVEDVLVHNCGKKIRELMAKERDKFELGCETTGYGRKMGKELFDVIEKFADYAFNKSHTFGYGLVTYQTAYLKAHYPVEYFSCLLTSVKTTLDKAAVYLADCRASAIKVLNPHINLSSMDFAPLPLSQVPADVQLPVGSPGAITFGLSAVRNVGEGLVEQLLAERNDGGPFVSFYDFAERVPEPVLNKRAVESLIKAGAFDSLGHARKGLLAVFEQVIDTTVVRRRERDQGVMSLFEDLGGSTGGGAAFDERVAIPIIEFDKNQRLRFEKEMLGLYVSDHPLMGVEAALRRRTDCTIGELGDRPDGDAVVVGGVITNLTKKFTKKGDQMAVFVLEDLQDSIEVMLFPRAMMDQGHKLADDAVVTVRGRVDSRDDTPKLICNEITVVEGLDENAAPLRLRISPNQMNDIQIGKLKRLLREHPGDSRVYLEMPGGKTLRLTDDYSVELQRIVPELRILLGHDAVLL